MAHFFKLIQSTAKSSDDLIKWPSLFSSTSDKSKLNPDSSTNSQKSIFSSVLKAAASTIGCNLVSTAPMGPPSGNLFYMDPFSMPYLPLTHQHALSFNKIIEAHIEDTIDNIMDLFGNPNIIIVGIQEINVVDKRDILRWKMSVGWNSEGLDTYNELTQFATSNLSEISLYCYVSNPDLIKEYNIHQGTVMKTVSCDEFIDMIDNYKSDEE